MHQKNVPPRYANLTLTSTSRSESLGNVTPRQSSCEEKETKTTAESYRDYSDYTDDDTLFIFRPNDESNRSRDFHLYRNT